MRRPIPTLPRGPGLRRRGTAAPRALLLACPRVSPEWELGALRALMKPHEWTRGAIAHKPAAQTWAPGMSSAVEQALRDAADRLSLQPPPRPHFPDGGDFWFVVEIAAGRLEDAKALAAVASKRLPGLWLTVGRFYVRDGKFFRRKRTNTFKFRIVPAARAHLTREVRAALRGML